MKNIFKTSALLFISISLLTISSCKKEDNKDSKPAATTKAKLTNKDFKLTDANLSVNTITVLSYADLDACEVDNLTKFMDDLTGTIDEGPTKCDPADPQQTSFVWSLVTNDTQLRIDDNGDISVLDIKINNGTTLKLEQIETGYFDNDSIIDNIVITFTYTKQ